jgi:hypothetical protein
MTMQLIEGGATGAEPLSKKQIADLKAQHGEKLVLAETETGEAFVFRRPSRAEWRRYMSVLLNERRAHERDVAGEQLCVDTLVYPAGGDGPDTQRLRKTFDLLPGLALQIIGDISDLAGAGQGQKVGKL